MSLGQHVTLKLTEPLTGSGHNVTIDNFFTSLVCMHKLHACGLTMLGTIMRHLCFFPDKMHTVGRRPLHATDFCFSALHCCCKHGTTQKLQAILDYNATKGGVDAVDEQITTYSVK